MFEKELILHMESSLLQSYVRYLHQKAHESLMVKLETPLHPGKDETPPLAKHPTVQHYS